MMKHDAHIQEPSAILDRMADGFARFQEKWCTDGTLDTSLLNRQSPKAVVIACSDSRVDPAIVLDAEPGELFVVRNVGNLVPPFEPDGQRHGVSAALEYAVRILRIPDILIMGHARCGGYAGMLDTSMPMETSFLDAWMATAAKAIRIADAQLDAHTDMDERLEAYAMWGIRLSLENLMGFPWIAERVAEGSLRLHGLYFDMTAGTLLHFTPGKDHFVPVQPVQGCAG